MQPASLSGRRWKALLLTFTLLAVAAPAAGVADSIDDALADRSTEEFQANPLSYLFAGGKNVYRLRWRGPVASKDGQKLGSKLTYLGVSRSHAAARQAAKELMQAAGPQFELEGETRVVVLSLLASPPVAGVLQYNDAYPIVYALEHGRWVQTLAPEERTKTIGEGPLAPADDPAFPLDLSGLTAGAAAAAHWMEALDLHDEQALRRLASAGYAASQDFGALIRFTEKRTAGTASSPRRELWRSQVRGADRVLPPSGGVLVLYEVQLPSFGRSLEQVAMAKERGEWRVWSFISRSFPAKPK